MKRFSFCTALLACGLCCSFGFATDKTQSKVELTNTGTSRVNATPQNAAAPTGVHDTNMGEKEQARAEFEAMKAATDRAWHAAHDGDAQPTGGIAADTCGAAPTVAEGSFAFDNTASVADGQASACGFNNLYANWYDYVASGTGSATVSFCGGATVDTQIQVFASCGGASIACNDDFCGLQSSLSFAATSGTHYKVRAAGYNGNRFAGTLTIALAGGGGGNDECAGATVITNGTTHADNTNATTSADAGCGATADLWYDYTATCDGQATVTTCLNGGAGIDSIVEVWSGCGGTLIACADDSGCPAALCGFAGSTVNWQATNGTHYRIRAGAYNNCRGGFDITLSCAQSQPCPPCPAGARQEGEVACSDGYVDNFDGGCNSAPNVFVDVNCGDTICGTTGTYLFNGLQYRDTDWYRVCTTGGNLTVTATGSFPVRVFVLTGVCPTAVIATNAGGEPACSPVSATATGLAAGTYFVFVGADVFTGVPCGTPYVATITCTGCAPGGACCFANQTCTDVGSLAACNALGGVFHQGFTCGSFQCPPPAPVNDDCAGALPIADGTTHVDNTGATTSPDAGCGATNDLWYDYTASCTGQATVTTCLNGGAGIDSIVEVWSACGGTLIACADDSGCPAVLCGFAGSTVQWNVTQGTHYRIRAGAFGGCVGPFDITLSCAASQPCPPCPAGARQEGEVDCSDGYVDNYDGGCNSTPNVFVNVNCGDTICGTTGTYLFNGLNYRDTDWYAVCTTGGDLTVTATGSFALRVFILQGVCPAVIISTNAGGELPCSPVTATATGLAAGTYYVFVGADVFTGVPCGTPYVATITCTGCAPGGACCLPNFGGCQDVASLAACNALNGTFHQGSTCGNFVCPAPPPANDECTGAIAICVGTTHFDTTNATNSPQASPCGLFGADLWYSYRPATSGAASATTCLGGIAGMDTVLAVYDACNGNLIGCDDDGGGCAGTLCGFSGSIVNWSAVGGTNYIIRVSGFNTCRGAADLTITGPACNPCAGSLRGDANCDGVVNNFDIDCFVIALTQGQAGWAAHCQHNNCDFTCVNDINGDHAVNNFDIDPFVNCLTHGCP